jgi:antitoxin HigA-1
MQMENTMHKPSHPGFIIRDDVLPELQISVSEAAVQLGVSRVTLSRVINGRSAISADMALRVGKWVGNGPDIWLRMQGQYDLWQARKNGEPQVNLAKRPAVQPVISG